MSEPKEHYITVGNSRTMQPTMKLRVLSQHPGNSPSFAPPQLLQQAWMDMATGHLEWVAVPIVHCNWCGGERPD